MEVESQGHRCIYKALDTGGKPAVSFLFGTSFLTVGPVRPSPGSLLPGRQREARVRCGASGLLPTPPRGVPRCLLTVFSLVFLRPSLVKPLRHYAVFLSEDSSDDECQREEGPSSGFTESFFFSAPFEWSLLPSSISLSSAW